VSEDITPSADVNTYSTLSADVNTYST